MKLNLSEPIVRTVEVKQLVALCAVADTLIERVQRVPKAVETFDVQILQQLEAMCKQVSTKNAQVRAAHGRMGAWANAPHGAHAVFELQLQKLLAFNAAPHGTRTRGCGRHCTMLALS